MTWSAVQYSNRKTTQVKRRSEGVLPCSEVAGTGLPIVDGEDVKVLLQSEALEHQLYPIVVLCQNHPRAVGIVGVAVRVTGALYCPVWTV